VEAICDRVIIINKGNIVADDTLANLQKGKEDTHILNVQFNEKVEIGILERLQTVFRIDEISSSNFRLYTANPDLVRKHLFNLSVAYNLNIVSLQTEGNSLESIFKRLTKGLI
jgi:ABC-2 type transport system ATP-binding protein